MHLLIDVRLASTSDLPFLHYGLLWAELWKSYHTNDDITFLAHENDAIENFECIRVKKTWHSFARKKIASHHHGPERVVSFSRLPPYDPSIKHISHISDLAPLLFPVHPLQAIEYQWQLREYRKFLKESSTVVIPHRDITTNISEFLELPEEKLVVIPYFSPVDEEIHRLRTILPHGVYGDYFITEGTASLEWRPLELLKAYSTYIHRMGGKEKLIILGDLTENLGIITSMIRTLDLMDQVKIIGTLSREERELLYVHAKAWIYAGSYYSRGPSIALASGYGVPLFFSDISGLRNYTGIYFHVNHIERLPELLRTEKEKHQIQIKTNNEAIMQVYTRIISE